MPQPATTASHYPDAWHAAEETEERAWLDQWARIHLIPVTPEPQRPLIPAGSPQ